MLNTPFSPWPNFSEEEADAVQRVLLSNKVSYWTGQECRDFEKEFASFASCKFAVALANGTLALDIALKALGIAAGDEVVVTPRTFFASVSSIVIAGAVPVFADVDSESQNISADTIASAITAKTKAIVVVHLAGWPCDMDAILTLAKNHGLFVIEDCAQAHGAEYKSTPVGSLGDIGCWSFCQDKIMTTGGEGGMVTTNRQDLWSKMWSLKDHGKSRETVFKSEHPSGFRWLHESFGTNARMTEMQAVIGRIQLKRMPEWSAQRQANSATLDSVCREMPALRVPEVPDHIEHARYKHYVFVRPEKLGSGWTRDRIIDEINLLGVPCYHGSCPEIYLEKSFEGTGFRPNKRLPVAKELGETSLMFLVHPSLTKEEVQKTCDVIEAVMVQAPA